MRCQETVEIDASAAVVWDTWKDVERWREWTTSLEAAEWVDGGSFALGGRARIKQPGMPPLVWQISHFEPEQSFTWESSVPGVRTVATHRLAALAPDRTAATIGLTQVGPLSWLTGLVAGRRTRRYVALEAAGLRARCSSGSF